MNPFQREYKIGTIHQLGLLGQHPVIFQFVTDGEAHSVSLWGVPMHDAEPVLLCAHPALVLLVLPLIAPFPTPEGSL